MMTGHKKLNSFVIASIIPPANAKKTETKPLMPKHNFDEGTSNIDEHVITESDAIELIVPVHQPNRCACISRGLLSSYSVEVKILNKTVLEITG